MSPVRLIASLLAAGLWTLSVASSSAQGPSDRHYPRVRPPDFDSSESSGIFFKDLFSEALQGDRPATIGSPSGTLPGTAKVPSPSTPASPAPAGGSAGGWSRLIAASSLEDEIKAIKLKVDQAVSTPNQFRGRDYKSCRLYFTELAMLFGIIEEYDGDVRWKDSSPALRQAFARAAANCKTGSDQAFSEAKLRKLDLQDAVGGGAVNLPEARPRENWEGVCDRSPLMQRLEAALQEQLRSKTANQADFQANQEDLYREAQLVSAIGRVLKQEGMMDAGDEEYDGFCDAMTGAAQSLAEAIKASSYEKAASAVGQISQACSSCHEMYR